MLSEPEVSLWRSTELIARGVVYSLLSGALLGSLIILPGWMSEYSAIELVAGRFAVFGLWVFIIVLFRREIIKRVQQGGIMPWIWVALLTNLLYYLFLIISIRSLGGVFACILIAALPMIFQKCFLERNAAGQLTTPLLLLIGALFLLISQKFDQSYPGSHEQSMVIGLLWLMLASICWLAGTRIQLSMATERPDIDPSDRYLLTGLGSILALPMIYPLTWLNHPELTLFPGGIANIDWTCFLGGVLVAGVLATGLARICRHKAVAHNSDSGFYSYTTLEALFGVLFVFMLEGRTPNNQEWAVIAILVWGMALFYRNQATSQFNTSSG
ncbi:DMT family transporter [Endozoicomonas sp. 8E]|uniref:DMT family transporter n=1 Tax=Endozoicomonas sp. 8E TaxID=3035692 RepID=UPI0029393F5C|nr:DMT family transporter [Endozoicomonas sp. 8E]WOG29705.1 DMT family transporter [Endozoicomonas sp. 8E]